MCKWSSCKIMDLILQCCKGPRAKSPRVVGFQIGGARFKYISSCRTTIITEEEEAVEAVDIMVQVEATRIMDSHPAPVHLAVMVLERHQQVEGDITVNSRRRRNSSSNNNRLREAMTGSPSNRHPNQHRPLASQHHNNNSLAHLLRHPVQKPPTCIDDSSSLEHRHLPSPPLLLLLRCRNLDLDSRDLRPQIVTVPPRTTTTTTTTQQKTLRLSFRGASVERRDPA